MGIDYTQHCIIGTKINLQELEVITSPAVYELQNRYDVTTGKVKEKENVLVKQKKSHYEFEGKIYHVYWQIVNNFSDKQPELGGFFDVYNQDLYLGFVLKNCSEILGRIDLILTLDTIKEKFDLMQKRFPNYPIKMYFVPYIE